MNNKQIFNIITEIIGEVKAVAKTHKNQNQNYFFRSTDDILNVVNPLFAKHKLIFVAKYSLISSEVLESNTGKRQIRSLVQGNFTFYAQDGSFVEFQTIGEAIDLADKSFSKAMSNSFKYCLINAFLIPTEKEEASDVEHIEKLEEIKFIENENFATEKQVKYIYTLLNNNEIRANKIKEFYKVKSMNEISKKQAFEIIKSLEEFNKKMQDKKETA